MNIKAYLKNPFRVFYHFNYTKISHLLSDKSLIKLIFRARVGYKLDLENPKTFNEKLQWLKLYDRRPEYTDLVDKAAVKRFVSNQIGEKYIVPQLGVWKKFDDIEFDSLPNQFVLKTTHDSGSVIICKDKSSFNIDEAREKLNSSLQRDFYLRGREWPYKNVPRRIIAEQYLEDIETGEARDYKFFCFNGKAKVLFVATNRQTDTRFDFYDLDFRHLPIVNGHPNSEKKIKKPNTFYEMIQLSERLSSGIPHVRVDFYEINNKIYFGEMTFFHYSGFTPFEPEIWDRKFGDLLVLPEKKI